MKWKEGGQFENPPPGSHIARCIGLIDLGTQTHSFNNEQWTSRDVRITWELPCELMTGKYNEAVAGKPFAVSKVFKQSMHPAASLRQFLESWRGKKFTKDELGKYDPKKLIGAPCRLTLVENGDYINVDGISKLGKETCPPQVNASVYFSLEADEFDSATLKELPEKTRDKIMASPEYSALMSPKAVASEEHTPEAPEDMNAADDSVPF